jgi:thiol:disulfide interchange protein DsbC
MIRLITDDRVSGLKGKMTRAVLVLLLVHVFLSARVSASGLPSGVKTTVDSLKSRLGLTVESVNPVGAHLYEVVYSTARGEKGLIYLTADGAYILLGALMDKNLENITLRREEELNRIKFSDLPLKSAVVWKKGDGQKKLAVFWEPDCPFSVEAFRFLEGRKDFTAYVFFLPLEGLHPGVGEKVKHILCSGDQVDAMRRAFRGEKAGSDLCERAEEILRVHIEAARKLGIGGVPVFVLGDGRKVRGFNPDRLKAYFED